MDLHLNFRYCHSEQIWERNLNLELVEAKSKLNLALWVRECGWERKEEPKLLLIAQYR